MELIKQIKERFSKKRNLKELRLDAKILEQKVKIEEFKFKLELLKLKTPEPKKKTKKEQETKK